MAAVASPPRHHTHLRNSGLRLRKPVHPAQGQLEPESRSRAEAPSPESLMPTLVREDSRGLARQEGHSDGSAALHTAGHHTLVGRLWQLRPALLTVLAVTECQRRSVVAL